VRQETRKFDYSKSLVGHENQWIALSKKDGKIMDSDASLERLLERIKEADVGNYEFMKVPRFDVCYAPLA
jgi:hypothetical protein